MFTSRRSHTPLSIFMSALLGASLNACDTGSSSTSDGWSANVGAQTAELGELRGAMRVAPDMACHHFELIDQETDEVMLNLDLSQTRLINGQYSFQRLLTPGDYQLIGSLSCDVDGQDTIYESFPETTTITAQSSSDINLRFIFNQSSSLDQVNLQLCAELALSALSHGEQICVGDTFEAQYDVRWLAAEDACQDLKLKISLNNQVAQERPLVHGEESVSISMTPMIPVNYGKLGISIHDERDARKFIYVQNLDVVACDGETASLDPALDPDYDPNFQPMREGGSDEEIDQPVIVEPRPVFGSSIFALTEPVTDNTNQHCYVRTGVDPIQGGLLDETHAVILRGLRITGFEVEQHDADHQLIDRINQALAFTLMRAELTPDHRLQIVSKDANFNVSFLGDAQEMLGMTVNSLSTAPCQQALMCVELEGSQISGGMLDASTYLSINDQRISGFEVSALDADRALSRSINRVTEVTGVRAEMNEEGTLKLISDAPFTLESAGGAFDIVGVESATSRLTVSDEVECSEAISLDCYQVDLDAAMGGLLDESQYITVNGHRISGFEVSPHDQDRSLSAALEETTRGTGTRFMLVTTDVGLNFLRSNHPIHIEVTGDASSVTGFPAGLHQGSCQ